MPPIAHRFLDLDGAWGAVAEVVLFLVLFLYIAALVVVSERGGSTRRKLCWGLFILFVPIVGPAVALGVTLRAADPEATSASTSDRA